MRLLTRLFALRCLGLAAALLAGCAGTPSRRQVAPPGLSGAERDLALRSFDRVWTTVRDKHWDPSLHGLDWAAVRDTLRPRVERARTMAEARAAMQAALATLGQTHFAIFPSETRRSLGEAPGGEGRAGFDVRVLDGQAIVTEVEPGSAAYDLGVRQGWELLDAGGQELRPILATITRDFAGQTLLDHLAVSAVHARLHGPPGRVVDVRFRDGQERVVAVSLPLKAPPGTRAVLGSLPPFYARLESRHLEDGVGYIYCSGFFDPNGVMGGFGAAMTEFMSAPGVIIDLRGNPGGIGVMATGMSGWLVEAQGLVLGRMITRDSELKFAVSPRPVTYGGKVAILIDGLSASTAEIMAAGLRDLGRARLFGTRTAGAALPSYIEELPNGDGFQYAVADYVSQGGRQLEGRGAEPDVLAPHTRADLLAGRDNALAAALAWILGAD